MTFNEPYPAAVKTWHKIIVHEAERLAELAVQCGESGFIIIPREFINDDGEEEYKLEYIAIKQVT